jgi:hypothetical protein
MEWLIGKEVAVEESDIINRYHQLNDTGKAEFMRFLDTLLSDENYKR